MADFHTRREFPLAMECRFDHVITKNLADTKCVLRENGDNFLHWDDLNVLLDALVLAAQEMALVRDTCFPASLARQQIDFEYAGVETGYFRDIHVEFPHRFQWRIYDYFLFGAESRIHALSARDCRIQGRA